MEVNSAFLKKRVPVLKSEARNASAEGAKPLAIRGSAAPPQPLLHFDVFDIKWSTFWLFLDLHFRGQISAEKPMLKVQCGKCPTLTYKMKVKQ